jgi:16S rRNA C1402 (ribose-2'-O) methylase RsmI
MDGNGQPQASDGRARRKPPLPPGLHIVATPIGNLGDITLRALDVLAAADLIACEDTRVFAKLAGHHGIGAQTISYSDATQDANEPRILRALNHGKRVALVSDAGMPLISDPGYRLVRAALAAGHAVSAVPGPSAVPMALALSGLPTDRFFFGGFLPAVKGRDVQGLYEAMVSLIDAPTRLQMGRMARAFAEANRVEEPFTAILDSEAYRRRLLEQHKTPNDGLRLADQTLDLSDSTFEIDDARRHQAHFA